MITELRDTQEGSSRQGGRSIVSKGCEEESSRQGGRSLVSKGYEVEKKESGQKAD